MKTNPASIYKREQYINPALVILGQTSNPGLVTQTTDLIFPCVIF